MRLTALITIVLFALNSTARAIPLEICNAYYEPAATASRFVNDFLSKASGSGIAECKRIAGPGAVYYALSPPHRANGICRFSATAIYPHGQGSEAIVWNDEPAENPRAMYPRRDYASDSTSPIACPPQRDASYTQVNSLTDAQFEEVITYWRHITASEKDFDIAFSISTDRTKRPDYPPLKSLVFGRTSESNIAYLSVSREGYHIELYQGAAIYLIDLDRSEHGLYVAKFTSGVT